MGMLVRLRLAKFAAIVTAVALMIPYVGGIAVAANATSPVTKTVVVFPLDNATTAPAIADAVTSYVRGGLGVQSGYTVVAYSERLPAIQRVIRLDPDKAGMISGPFYADRKAVSNAIALGRMMEADFVVVGSIDRYNVSNAGVADLGASVEMIDVESGKTVRTVVVTGHSGSEVALATSTQRTVENEAIADVGQKIVTGLTGEDYKEIGKTSPEKAVVKKKSRKWIGYLLAAVVIGLLASGSDSGGSSSGENPPPPPF